MKHEIAAGIIIFRRTSYGPRFLLLYHGGQYWNFPKGKLESEERGFQAALREVREETGLNKNDLRFVSHFREREKFIFTRNREKVFKVVLLYLAETRRTVIKVSHEHEGYAWLNLDEAKNLLKKYPQNLGVLRRANDFIQRKGMENRSRDPRR